MVTIYQGNYKKSL